MKWFRSLCQLFKKKLIRSLNQTWFTWWSSSTCLNSKFTLKYHLNFYFPFLSDTLDSKNLLRLVINNSEIPLSEGKQKIPVDPL